MPFVQVIYWLVALYFMIGFMVLISIRMNKESFMDIVARTMRRNPHFREGFLRGAAGTPEGLAWVQTVFLWPLLVIILVALIANDHDGDDDDEPTDEPLELMPDAPKNKRQMHLAVEHVFALKETREEQAVFETFMNAVEPKLASVFKAEKFGPTPVPPGFRPAKATSFEVNGTRVVVSAAVQRQVTCVSSPFGADEPVVESFVEIACTVWKTVALTPNATELTCSRAILAYTQHEGCETHPFKHWHGDVVLVDMLDDDHANIASKVLREIMTGLNGEHEHEQVEELLS